MSWSSPCRFASQLGGRQHSGAGSGLPDAVAGLAQADRELHLHLARGLVGHRVVDGVQLGQQPQPVLEDEAVGLDAGLVLVEAQVGVEAGHADVDARPRDRVVGVGLAEGRLVPDAVVEQHHVDMVGLAGRAAGGGHRQRPIVRPRRRDFRRAGQGAPSKKGRLASTLSGHREVAFPGCCRVIRPGGRETAYFADDAAAVAPEAALAALCAWWCLWCLAGAEAASPAAGAEAAPWAKETAAKEESRAATMKVLVILQISVFRRDSFGLRLSRAGPATARLASTTGGPRVRLTRRFQTFSVPVGKLAFRVNAPVRPGPRGAEGVRHPPNAVSPAVRALPKPGPWARARGARRPRGERRCCSKDPVTAARSRMPSRPTSRCPTCVATARSAARRPARAATRSTSGRTSAR